jgi:hypothetical protein
MTNDGRNKRPMSLRRGPSLGTALLIGAALLCGACAERVVYDTPYFRTRILDGATFLPVANASVTVWSRRDPRFRATTRSDANGIAFLPPATRDTSFFGWYDEVPPAGGVRIEAAGYLSQELALTPGAAHSDLVALTPAN